MNSVLTIDLRMLRASGIGTYLVHLIPLVVTNHPEIKFNLLGRVEELLQYPWVEGKNIVLFNCCSRIYSIAEQLELFQKIQKETTLFWSPHYNIPLLYRGKLLVTVHDVCHLAMPHLTGGIHKQVYAKGMFSALSHKANSILCVSKFSKDEMLRVTGNNHPSIHFVYNGISSQWFHIQKQQNPHQKPYLLFVGNVKPHKNLGRLLQAFHLVFDKLPHDLLLVGKKEGFLTGDPYVAAMAAELSDRVHFTGYVDDKVLQQYFVHADALIFPSLYEGFGLPPLEAMACGCPVIVSDAASLPEVCGDAALYCNPYSPEDIATKISILIANPSLREELRQKGLERAKQFSWEKCAHETFAVIKKTLSS